MSVVFLFSPTAKWMHIIRQRNNTCVCLVRGGEMMSGREGLGMLGIGG
jgi:hypothetical protein